MSSGARCIQEPDAFKGPFVSRFVRLLPLRSVMLDGCTRFPLKLQVTQFFREQKRFTAGKREENFPRKSSSEVRT